MDWPHRSPRVGALILTFGKCFGGAPLPRALALSVQGRQKPDVLAEVPDSVDRNFAREVSVLSCGGNPEYELTAAVELEDQSFGVEKPRVGQFFRRSVIRCHTGFLGRFERGVHTFKI